MSENQVPSELGDLPADGGLPVNPPPLIATKIQVPRRRSGLLPRQRLVNFFHAHLDRKLILLSAPAGYGKTTLLTEFAHDTDLPVCWYTLDAFDQDLHAFLEYLISAIARRFPAFGARSRALLHEVPDPGSNLYPLVATLVQEIYDTIPEYFVLILDDHHTVEAQDQISEFLDLFLTYTDENCHLILASRTLPALPNLSLLVARRQAAGLSIDELRFTGHEIQALAQQNYGLSLGVEQAETLAQRTGGWITGLLLTAAPRWAQSQEDVPIRGRISVDLYTYLSKQVLDQQPPPLREFLLASSVLDELSADLCTAVLGVEQPDVYLDLLRERNLFVTEYETGGFRLRYHDLFREFLQASLRRLDEGRFRELTRRAADTYADRGEWDRAVSRYLALQDYEPVARIVSRSGRDLFEAGRWDTLAGWIDALPEPVQSAHPLFWVDRGRIHVERGEYAPALALYERALRASAPDARLQIAHVLTTKSLVLRFQGRYDEAIAQCREALELVGGETAQEQVVMALAHRNIGLSLLRQGRLAEGQGELLKALHLYEELDAAYDVALAHHDLGLSHELGGNLPEAIEQYQAALRHWEKAGSLGPWANTLNGLGVVYYLLGRYDEALPILKEALTRAQQAGDLRVEAFAWASLGDLHRDLGAFEQARQAFEQALEVAERIRLGFIVTYALNALGSTWRLQGELIQARQYLERAGQHAEAQGAGYEIALCHTSLGILSSQECDLVAARHHLDQAIAFFEPSGFQQELCRAWLYRAQVAFLAGQLDAALTDLDRSLSLVEQLGLDQFLVVDGQYLQRLLNYALEQDMGGDLLPRLLKQIRAHQVRLATHPEPVVRPEPEPELRICALGRPRVEVDGQPVQWPLALSRDLFFCLLQHPLGLRREQIGDIFWPEHSPAKLESAFRSTLYRLRRTLFRNSILFEEGLYRFNWLAGHWFDVEAFEKRLDQAQQTGAPEKAIESLEEALALYRGDYLEGIYADWSTLERERLRGRHLTALETLAGLHAERRSLPRAIELYQALLKQDPYREAAHRELMRCHYRRGDRGAAVRQYQDCTEVLREDLGLSPSPETEALYLQIIA